MKDNAHYSDAGGNIGLFMIQRLWSMYSRQTNNNVQNPLSIFAQSARMYKLHNNSKYTITKYI
ncbi:hypothetical protein BLOT_004924 [Blomia tropicalis]|nr:hypothetical protein BLOT_004924 [Blomia tropicalis]